MAKLGGITEVEGAANSSKMARCGGITEVKDAENSLEMASLARFAVDEHNKKECSHPMRPSSAGNPFFVCFEFKLPPNKASPITWSDHIWGCQDYSLEEESMFLGTWIVPNACLEFSKVVNAKKQVVSGMMYYITLEATNGGQKKAYEAKVWEKSWMKFKELREFKPIGDPPSQPSA
ncbi:unnamed protein product [Camellia sinensis]